MDFLTKKPPPKAKSAAAARAANHMLVPKATLRVPAPQVRSADEMKTDAGRKTPQFPPGRKAPTATMPLPASGSPPSKAGTLSLSCPR